MNQTGNFLPSKRYSTDEVLRQQRHRGMVLRDRLRKFGDRIYDPDAALLKRFSPFFPRFTGHTVGQQSLEYAILLLHSDDRTYGADDAGEANRILRKILEYQDLRPGSDTCGNFFWMTHWDRVKDHNAVSFLCAGLVYAYLTFPNKLQDKTKSALERAFPEMLKGIRKHKVPWQRTNIFFLNLAGLVSLSRVLNDPSVHSEAVEDFNAWLEGTSNDGFHEFNSPTYTPVTLVGMETAWANTRDKEFRARLRRTMDIITYQFALNLSSNGFLGGAASRVYQNDVIHGNGLSAYYAHLKFGTPCPPPADDAPILSLHQTLFDYTPPEFVRTLALEKAEYAEIHDRSISSGDRRTHVITPKYSLASQCTERIGGHSPSTYVMIVRNVSSPRNSIPFLPDESFTHQPCAAFKSRQALTRIIGRLHYDLAEDQREKFLADPTFICEPRMLFGLRNQIREIRVGNVDWGGGDICLLPGQSVAVSYGNLYVGVVPLLLDRAGRPAREHALLAYGEDGELRLHLFLFGGHKLCRKDDPLDAIIFVELKISGPDDSLFSYAEELAKWQLSQKGTGRNVSFSAKHTNGTKIAYPFTKADPAPIGNALHVSPGLKLHPGDLVKIVNGKKPAFLT